MSTNLNNKNIEEGNEIDEVNLIYRYKIYDIDSFKMLETLLIKIDRSKFLKPVEADYSQPEPYDIWIASDDAKQRVMIWGRLKLSLNVDTYGFKEYNIALVRKAINGCDKAYAELKNDALLYIYNSLENSHGVIECLDCEQTSQRFMRADTCLDPLLDLKALVARAINKY